VTRIFNKSSEREKRQRLRHEMPQAELILWSQVRGKQVHDCRFRRQYSVGPFVIDFYAPSIKLAIELDGATHDSVESQEYDAGRQEQIESLGITFLRFSNDEVYHNLSSVLNRIAATVDSLRNEKEQGGKA
jgi:very-short-patch-repair endonuclease